MERVGRIKIDPLGLIASLEPRPDGQGFCEGGDRCFDFRQSVFGTTSNRHTGDFESCSHPTDI